MNYNLKIDYFLFNQHINYLYIKSNLLCTTINKI